MCSYYNLPCKIKPVSIGSRFSDLPCKIKPVSFVLRWILGFLMEDLGRRTIGLSVVDLWLTLGPIRTLQLRFAHCICSLAPFFI